MLSKNTGIVLSKIKYKDYDLIVKCYTENRGVVSYLIKGVLKSKKSAMKTVYFQPLSQIQYEETFKPNQSLHYFKEVKPILVYKTLHHHIYKSSIVLFIAEILSQVLKEESSDKQLFHFLKHAFEYLDAEDDYANFHLLFLLRLTRYFGFEPEDSRVNYKYFNLESGVFENHPTSAYTLQDANLNILKQLLRCNFASLEAIKLNSKQRQSFLNALLLYYELHIDGFRQPKSLAVLEAVFH